MRFLKAILPNLTIDLAVAVVVVVIVHSHNPMMGFLTGTPFKILAFLFCGCSIATSVVLYYLWRCDECRRPRHTGKH